MVYVGIDLHRKRSHVAVVDERDDLRGHGPIVPRAPRPRRAGATGGSARWTPGGSAAQRSRAVAEAAGSAAAGAAKASTRRAPV